MPGRGDEQQFRLTDGLMHAFGLVLRRREILLMMGGFDLVGGRLVDPSLHSSIRFSNFSGFALQETDQRVTVLKDARSQASALPEQISAAIE
jgi:hypothetical protein